MCTGLCIRLKRGSTFTTSDDEKRTGNKPLTHNLVWGYVFGFIGVDNGDTHIWVNEISNGGPNGPPNEARNKAPYEVRTGIPVPRRTPRRKRKNDIEGDF